MPKTSLVSPICQFMLNNPRGSYWYFTSFSPKTFRTRARGTLTVLLLLPVTRWLLQSFDNQSRGRRNNLYLNGKRLISPPF